MNPIQSLARALVAWLDVSPAVAVALSMVLLIFGALAVAGVFAWALERITK